MALNWQGVDIGHGEVVIEVQDFLDGYPAGKEEKFADIEGKPPVPLC